MLLRDKKNALLVVDLQNDFCPGGTLAVAEGDAVVPVINRIAGKFYRVVATQDWHPVDHVSFARSHPGRNPYETIPLSSGSQVLWPVHCVAGSKGADFHPRLETARFHLILRKGTQSGMDSYSAFLENDYKTQTGLEGYLRGLGIKEVLVSGLATDYCVLSSALDAVSLGFETFLIRDACRGVDFPEHNVEKALQAMKDHGIRFVSSTDI